MNSQAVGLSGAVTFNHKELVGSVTTAKETENQDTMMYTKEMIPTSRVQVDG